MSLLHAAQRGSTGLCACPQELDLQQTGALKPPAAASLRMVIACRGFCGMGCMSMLPGMFVLHVTQVLVQGLPLCTQELSQAMPYVCVLHNT